MGGRALRKGVSAQIGWKELTDFGISYFGRKFGKCIVHTSDLQQRLRCERVGGEVCLGGCGRGRRRNLRSASRGFKRGGREGGG